MKSYLVFMNIPLNSYLHKNTHRNDEGKHKYISTYLTISGYKSKYKYHPP